MYKASVKDLIEKFHLVNATPEIDVSELEITVSDINRPALQLAGFFDYFDASRVQIVGNVEYSYTTKLIEEGKGKEIEVYEKLFSYHIPCIIYCRGLQPREFVFEMARKYSTPILITNDKTSAFVSEVIRWLNVELAPRISIHGVLVDVYGEGILITGESGIGKSEAAIELIKRGHRLVSDDVVELKKISEETLVGSSPDITRHFIELRGIGIIDVKTLFGVECVKLEQNIDLVIQLEDWNRETNYDRLGLEECYVEYLGNKVACHSIPIRPGRNLAVIVESAAVNHRQKKMGYNAAQELYNRVTGSIKNKSNE